MGSTKNVNTTAIIDRRQGRRVSLVFDMEMKTGDGSDAKVQAVEVGPGGLRFLASFPLKPFSQLKARFVLPPSRGVLNGEAAFEVSATVLRCHALFSPANLPLFEVAIKFDALPVEEGYRLQRILDSLGDGAE